eukprot:TRINITY_DN909_c0_g1_i4.p1 TRINITY_DN909_c0_g1~~TRINITY_DN909_c0_g1_i4.p1  ORF type:complete len:223 (-),score=30.00 TRINITY_DN909_c0_g1_i4:156-761(-)
MDVEQTSSNTDDKSLSMEQEEIPDDANEHCPGPNSEGAGKSDACQGCPNQEICASNKPKGPDPDIPKIIENMKGIQHKILILSGKGGVGKSTFTSHLGYALAEMEYETGILDVDICGPSQPKILGVDNEGVHDSSFGWEPVFVEENLCVMSVGFLLDNKDDAIIWRGTKKNGLIKQFLRDVYGKSVIQCNDNSRRRNTIGL